MDTAAQAPSGGSITPVRTGEAVVAIVGAGRLGHALAAALRDAGRAPRGPLGREPAAVAGVDVVVLAVGDRDLAAAARAIRSAVGPAATLVHCAGAATLDVLGDGPRRASLHPLVSVPAGAGADVLRGAPAAVAGADAAALAVAQDLAASAGLRPFAVDDADRTAYHAAAALAANALVALEGAAEDLAATAGLRRDALVPLVRGAVEHWARAGAPAAITGPVARGDLPTVRAHRRAVAARAPELLGVLDALVPLAARTAARATRGTAPPGHAPAPDDRAVPTPTAHERIAPTGGAA